MSREEKVLVWSLRQNLLPDSYGEPIAYLLGFAWKKGQCPGNDDVEGGYSRKKYSILLCRFQQHKGTHWHLKWVIVSENHLTTQWQIDHSTSFFSYWFPIWLRRSSSPPCQAQFSECWQSLPAMLLIHASSSKEMYFKVNTFQQMALGRDMCWADTHIMPLTLYCYIHVQVTNWCY